MADQKRSIPDGYHIPVLLAETLEALRIDPGGIYLDGTAGGGGHAAAVASRLDTGRLVALDQDPDAVKAAAARLIGLPAVVIQSNFTEMRAVLTELGIEAADGILLDIGTSSHQLDTPERGFSYHDDAPLDMRMSQSGRTAADLVAELPERALVKMFFEYGEEPHARSIARAIVKAREATPVATTGQLAELICGAVPAKARRDGHPARQVFQALRVAVNEELERLSAALDTAYACLKPGGRLAVITFPSLEDRIVKRRFALWAKGCICPPDFPACACGNRPKVDKLPKSVAASPEEVAQNPRSRSARLRWVQKV
jgi:16S rRNA (cytosine1402-N4)-methyltransferase